MTPKEERATKLDQEISTITEELKNKNGGNLELSKHLEPDLPKAASLRSPVTLSQIEEALLNSHAFKEVFQENPKLAGSYLVEVTGEEHAVTFDPGLFDRYPNSLQLLTYGNPIFDELLNQVTPLLQDKPWGKFLCCRSEIPMVSYYAKQDDNVSQIPDYMVLKKLLDEESVIADWTQDLVSMAKSEFDSHIQLYRAKKQHIEKRRKDAQRVLLRERGQQLLVKAALVADSMDKSQEVISMDLEQRVQHGIKLLKKQKYPFTGLIKAIGFQQDAKLSLMYDEDYCNKSTESLQGYYRNFREQAEELLYEIAGHRYDYH